MKELNNNPDITNLHEYYTSVGFNPVYAGLNTEEKLNKYESLRRKIFEFNLRLPLQVFADAELLEFGPASGENSLVFAKWGANVHAVEPVKDYLDTLRGYFTEHGLLDRLKEATCESAEKYKSEKKFDIVVAEGFIHQLGEPSYWVPLLNSFCKKEGFIIFSHSEPSGFLIELLQAKCLQWLVKNNPDDPVLIAERLFKRKWEKVAHSRSFNSWVFDNLLNPHVKSGSLYSFIDIMDTMKELHLHLWSSWPALQNSNDVSWIKKEHTADKYYQKVKKDFFTLMPSLLTGMNIPMARDSDTHAVSLYHALRRELDMLSVAQSDLTSNVFVQTLEFHNKVGQYLDKIVQSTQKEMITQFWQEIKSCIAAMAKGDEDAIIDIFNSNCLLGTVWGSPNFYSVWHRLF